MKKFRTYGDFVDEVAKDDKLSTEIKNDPLSALNKVRIQDKWVFRSATWILGTIIILIVIGTLVLTVYDKALPEVLITTVGTAIGAIAGLISQNT